MQPDQAFHRLDAGEWQRRGQAQRRLQHRHGKRALPQATQMAAQVGLGWPAGKATDFKAMAERIDADPAILLGQIGIAVAKARLQTAQLRQSAFLGEDHDGPVRRRRNSRAGTSPMRGPMHGPMLGMSVIFGFFLHVLPSMGGTKGKYPPAKTFIFL